MKLALALLFTTLATMTMGGASAAVACNIFPLIAGGGNGIGTNAGTVTILDQGSVFEVHVESGFSGHVIYQIHAEAQCAVDDFPLTKKGSPKVGLMDVNIPYRYEGGVGDATFEVPKPDCVEGTALVGIHAEVEPRAGLDALNAIFPQPVLFKVETDAGSGDSFFNTEFLGDSVLKGMTIDGYCVDVDHTISSGTVYSGTAYLYLDPALQNTNIDKYENLDLVAWAINNFEPGTTYYSELGEYTLTPGTLQRAIWYIIDDNQSTNSLGAWNDDWALYISDLAMEQDGYEPGCGDLVPIILVPDSSNRQHTIIQTTFASLNIPCEVSGGPETAWAAMPGEPLKHQFSGSNWFTYVETC